MATASVGVDVFGPSAQAAVHQQHHFSSSGTTAAPSSSSMHHNSTTRPRSALSIGSGTSATLTAAAAAAESSSSSTIMAGSNSRAYQRLSTLESSGNENNQRMTSSMQVARFGRSGFSMLEQQQQQRDTAAAATSGSSNAVADVATTSSSAASKDAVAAAGAAAASSSSQQQQQQRRPSGSSSSSSSKQKAAAATTTKDSGSSSTDSVVIEEKRRRPNGVDGYTYHRYLRGRMLGKGGFAKVYLCTAMDTGKNYAVKIVPKANLVKSRARQKLQAEIKIHRTLKHKHVCEYKHFFEDRDNCYILLELCHNQSLNEMIKRRKRLTEPEAAFLMKQLLESVQYIHDENVIHRDLKLGNLFIDRNLHIKVGDFGLATRLQDKDEKRKTICGTPNYIAPEVIQNDKSKRGHSFEVDVWSMGVILYTVLIGKPPYEARDVKATYQRILNNEYTFPNHVSISEQSQDLIESMLQSDPKQRPSLEYIASHPFLNESCIPQSLPLASLHSAPTWRFDEDGRFVAEEDDTNVRRSRKGAPPRSSSRRQPFGSHDPNSAKPSSALRAKKDKPTASSTNGVMEQQQQHPGGDMQRLVKNVLTMSSAKKSQPPAVVPPPTAAMAAASPAGFQIFDESSSSKRQQHTTPISSSGGSAVMKPPLQSSSPMVASANTDDLVARTKALTIGSKQYRRSGNERSTSTTASSAYSSNNNAGPGESEADILQRMVGRLDTVLEVVETRRSQYRPRTPRASSTYNNASSSSLPVWVTRYVDYTSKYGLGFLLSDGSSGVYFNDSTKTALEANGDNFQYVERKKSDTVMADARRGDVQVTNYTLTDYPDALNKKVTLLKHFRNYLMEQHKQADEQFPSAPPSSSGHHKSGQQFVYLKKWMRTKHAILFRLSNQTVQVVFYDQTEVLLTPDDRYITYVDKNHNRQTYNFTDDVVGTFPELEKRIKYSRDIMHQLLSGQQQRQPQSSSNSGEPARHHA